MGDYLFSFKNYINLLNSIKKRGTLCDYTDVIKNPDSPFILLRHDVEFSPQRALDLAEVEHNHDVKSTYFFQITNNAYNILSGKNISRLKKILSLGHSVGLHFHLQGSDDIDEIKKRIIFECELLSHALDIKIDRFSFHRPSALVLEENICIPGIINAYNPLFFTYSKNPDEIDFSESVKYIADSKNQWCYTSPWDEPCEELFDAYPKMQILCHPYSWTEDGYSTLENLKTLINENRNEFIDTLNNETKYVKEYINEL